MSKRLLVSGGLSLCLVASALAVTIWLVEGDDSPPVLRKIKPGMTVPEINALLGRECDGMSAPPEFFDTGPWRASWFLRTGRIHVVIAPGGGAQKWWWDQKEWWEPASPPQTRLERIRSWLGW
jgi:hypothetical protein